jgi:Ni,Fe-hydrogenase III large subunit
VGRAAGAVSDLRLGDPLYEELGFSVVVRDEGDALARARARLEEAGEALRLAGEALARIDATAPEPVDLLEAAPGGAAAVEGPRGPVRVAHSAAGRSFALSSPGAEVVRRHAERSMVGHEWAAALVGLTSFDLSPWQVGR